MPRGPLSPQSMLLGEEEASQDSVRRAGLGGRQWQQQAPGTLPGSLGPGGRGPGQRRLWYR